MTNRTTPDPDKIRPECLKNPPPVLIITLVWLFIRYQNVTRGELVYMGGTTCVNGTSCWGAVSWCMRERTIRHYLVHKNNDCTNEDNHNTSSATATTATSLTACTPSSTTIAN
ncbi:hypothetical protein KIN20_035928 [Parelaphostrongylus tenuis]|uniref:Uncharacterized protein n=1 Tax=Parelaphostrongylus tenuis TaxID=148309 RepID=A0AAD5RBV9_PARTN|nr:hypothetical protein KIN20_035928 [Parelaphostrongylus tenuis]